MKLSLLAFGIAKDIFNNNRLDFELPGENATVDLLREQLETAFPELKRLASYMVAINDEYASGKEQLKESDEIAIIPPVSGG